MRGFVFIARTPKNGGESYNRIDVPKFPFVVRGDGLIQTAGTFLASPEVDVVLPGGLGARHLAAAAATKRTTSTAIVVSATDGNVRVFSGGSKVLHIDPDVPYNPIMTEP